jgi:hypothetical protein
MILETACDVIRNCLEQRVDYTAGDIVDLKGSGNDTLLIPQMPVVNLESVIRDDLDDVLDPEDYRLWDRQRLRTTAHGDTWHPWHVYSVTYDHGWALLPEDVDEDAGIFRVPGPLRMTALEVAAVGLVAGRTGVGGVRREQIGRYSYELDDQVNSVVLTVNDEQEYAISYYKSGAEE